jgi:tetratricopeptide (TPR) repeat protein
MRRYLLIIACMLLMLPGISSCAGAPPKPIELEKEKALDYANKGVRWFKKGCYSRALSLFENSLRINQSIDNLPGMAYDYNNIGMLALNTDKLNEARGFFTLAARIQRNLDNEAGLSLSLSNLATVDLKAENPDQAERHLEEAYQAANRSKDKLQQAFVVNLRGHLYWQKGLLARANDSVSKAVAIYEAKNNKSGLASACHNLGLIRMSEGNYMEAQTLWGKALELDQETLDYPGIAADLEMLAKLSLKQGRWPEAAEYARRAFNVCYNIGHKEKALFVLEILKKADETGNLNSPIASLEAKLKEMSSPDFDLPCR